MLCILRLFVNLLPCFLRSRQDLLLEILALRQQLAVLNAKRAAPKLRGSDKAFWVVLKQLWPRWERALLLVQPETVVRWHRAVFRFH
jgi:putative transposase